MTFEKLIFQLSLEVIWRSKALMADIQTLSKTAFRSQKLKVSLSMVTVSTWSSMYGLKLLIKFSLQVCDLSSVNDIKSFASRISSKDIPVHVLVIFCF